MTVSKLKETNNFNSVLITIVLAVSGWTLKKVSDQAEIAAGNTVRVSNLSDRVDSLDARVVENTKDIGELKWGRK